MAFKVKYLSSREPASDQQILEQAANELEAQGYGHIVAVVPIVQSEEHNTRTSGFLILAKSEDRTHR
jgi:hypothetical protein